MLVERWNGSRWSIQRTPKQSTVVLNGVSCPSAKACQAVGYLNPLSRPTRPLTERWNGTDWSMETQPRVRSRDSFYLEAISCSSARACTAVGGDEYTQSLVERWDGRSWSVQARAFDSGSFYGVSCPSANACIAVGTDLPGGGEGPVAQHWDGRRWEGDYVPGDPVYGEGSLDEVSCPFSRYCIAVGGFSTHAFISRWNGTMWTTRRTAWGLNAVSCISARNCIGVGQDVIVRWNGSSWSRDLVVRNAQFDAVSCSSPNACVAVGSNKHGVIAAQLHTALERKRRPRAAHT